MFLPDLLNFLVSWHVFRALELAADCLIATCGWIRLLFSMKKAIYKIKLMPVFTKVAHDLFSSIE